MRTGDLIDAIIGHATTSLDADKNRALEQREKRRTYGILCNFSYLPLILARYESRLESSVRRDIESGISNILLMQEERDPNTLNDVDLVTAENAQTRRLQFIRNFAQVPPENPDIFRETVENAYQLFRTLPAEERTDDLLSMLADTLMRRLQEV
ncbi:MAG TPA: hypothetical protein PK765_03115 [bacterium]|nr:hypothetical protein [bacterium]